jgi:hypothetical protein
MIKDLDFGPEVVSHVRCTVAVSVGTTVKSNRIEQLLTEEYHGAKGEFRSWVSFSSSEGVRLVGEVLNTFGFDIPKNTSTRALGFEATANIVTILVNPSLLKQLNGFIPEGLALVNVKFDLNSGDVHVKEYMLMQSFPYDEHPELPEGSYIATWARYSDFPGYPFPKHLHGCADLFFYNDNIEKVNTFFGSSFVKGKNWSGWGLRYIVDTLEVVKVKNYKYDDASVFGDWKKVVEVSELLQWNKGLMDDTMYLHAKNFTVGEGL